MHFQLIYCYSCCEPYHPFCTGDEDLLTTYVSNILPKRESNLSASTDGGRNGGSVEGKVEEDMRDLTLETDAVIPVYYNGTTEAGNPWLSPPLTPKAPGPTDLDMDRAKEIELKTLLRSWTCSRCYICYVCQSHSLPSSLQSQEVKFLKCPHCPLVVHSACCGPTTGRKGNSISSSATRVCDECLKCKSCGKKVERKRSKEDNGQVLCLECLRQKQKGSFCPVCEVCYDDNDYETKVRGLGKFLYYSVNLDKFFLLIEILLTTD